MMSRTRRTNGERLKLKQSYTLDSGEVVTGYDIVDRIRGSEDWVLLQLIDHTPDEVIVMKPKRRVWYDMQRQEWTVSQIARRSGVGATETLIRNRLDAGWTVEEACHPCDWLPERYGGIDHGPAHVAWKVPRAKPIPVSSPDLEFAPDPAPSPELDMEMAYPPITDWLRMPWDRRYMELAWFWSQNSKDPSTKVGAVIVGDDKRLVCMGYNGFPPGIRDDERLMKRETKYPLMMHAERNVLDNCQFDTKGATLYATLAPCAQCALSIISKGVRKVVCPPPLQNDQSQRLGIHAALETLEQGGVIVEFLERLG